MPLVLRLGKGHFVLEDLSGLIGALGVDAAHGGQRFVNQNSVRGEDETEKAEQREQDHAPGPAMRRRVGVDFSVEIAHLFPHGPMK